MPGKPNQELLDGIYEILEERGVVTTHEVATHIKTNRAMAAGRLTYLRKHGRIVGKRGIWALTNEQLKIKPAPHTNPTFSELSNILNHIIKKGLPNEKDKHS